jgi:hypothetical protein
MRSDAIFKRSLTADYWEWENVTAPDGVTVARAYHLVAEGKKFAVTASMASGTLEVFSDMEMQYNAQLRNPKDGNNLPLWSDGSGAYVGAGEPVFDIRGNKEGWRYNITRGVVPT